MKGRNLSTKMMPSEWRKQLRVVFLLVTVKKNILLVFQPLNHSHYITWNLIASLCCICIF